MLITKKWQLHFLIKYNTLTLRGRLYRRRYQLVFFKTSAKDIKNTPSILVVQISVIHQLKLWSVYFFCVHSRIQQNFVVLEKKKKTNRMRSLSSPSPRAAFQNTSLKMNCNSAKTQHTDMGVISIESWKWSKSYRKQTFCDEVIRMKPTRCSVCPV